MRTIWAILPVKTPTLSKTRLSSLLSEEECAGLAQAMMTDVITMLSACKHVAHIAVMTRDETMASIARKHNALIMLETIDDAGDNLNKNLNVVAEELQNKFVDGILIVPADLPTMDPAEIDTFIASHAEGDAVSLCPAEKDGGTNALLCTPPAAIPFKFGKNSAEAHRQTAEGLGLSVQQQYLSSLQCDIDEPDDLRWLVNQALKAEAGVTTSQYLAGSGISERLLHNKPKPETTP